MCFALFSGHDTGAGSTKEKKEKESRKGNTDKSQAKNHAQSSDGQSCWNGKESKPIDPNPLSELSYAIREMLVTLASSIKFLSSQIYCRHLQQLT